MSGLNTEGLENFKVPVLPRGKYEFEVMRGADCEGASQDENGQKSSGWDFNFQVVGPDTATLSDGNSALGYTFRQRVWFPREGLKAKNPQVAARMTKAAIQFMTAAFGTIPVGECHGKDFEHTRFLGTGRPKYDSFQKEDIFEIETPEPLVPEAQA